jgi:hypothetical protein
VTAGRDAAAAILAALAIGLFGSGLVRAGMGRPRGGAADRALRVALSLTLGIGAWSLAYAAQIIALGARGAMAKDAVLSIAGLALRFWANRSEPGRPTAAARAQAEARARAPRAPAWLTALVVLAAALFALIFVEHSFRYPDGGWDAWMTWNMRARFLVRAANPREAFSPDMLFWEHADYPWLLPAAVAQVFLIFGESRIAPAAVAFTFGALIAALLAAALARKYGPRAGLLGGLVLCATPCFVTFAANQQSDVPLALYLLAAGVLIEIGESPRAFALAGFAAGLCAFTKNEAAIYAGCLVAGLLLFRRRALAPFLLGVLPGFAVLVAFKVLVAPASTLVGESAFSRALHPGRWLELSLLGLRRIFYFQNLGLWAVAGIAAMALAWRKLLAHPLSVALVLSTLCCAGIYVIQPLPLEWIFRTSADRVFIELWPLAILVLLPALSPATART